MLRLKGANKGITRIRNNQLSKAFTPEREAKYLNMFFGKTTALPETDFELNEKIFLGEGIYWDVEWGENGPEKIIPYSIDKVIENLAKLSKKMNDNVFYDFERRL